MSNFMVGTRSAVIGSRSRMLGSLFLAALALMGCAAQGGSQKPQTAAQAMPPRAVPERIVLQPFLKQGSDSATRAAYEIISRVEEEVFKPDPSDRKDVRGSPGPSGQSGAAGCKDCPSSAPKGNPPPPTGYPRHALLVQPVGTREDDQSHVVAVAVLAELRNMDTGQVDFRRLETWRRFDDPAGNHVGDAGALEAEIKGRFKDLLSRFAVRDHSGYWVDDPERLSKEPRKASIAIGFNREGLTKGREVAHQSRVAISVMIADPELLSSLIIGDRFRHYELSTERRNSFPIPLRPGVEGVIDMYDMDDRPYIFRGVDHYPLQSGMNSIHIVGYDQAHHRVIDASLDIERVKPSKPVSQVLIWDSYNRNHPREVQPQKNLDLASRFEARGAKTDFQVQDDYSDQLYSLEKVRDASDPVVPGVVYFNGAARRLNDHLFLLGQPYLDIPDEELLDHRYSALSLPEDLYAIGDSSVFVVDACGHAQDPFLMSAAFEDGAIKRGLTPIPLIVYYDGPCGPDGPYTDYGPLRNALGRTVQHFRSTPKAEQQVANDKFLSRLKTELPGLIVVGGAALEANLATVLDPFAVPISAPVPPPPPPPPPPVRKPK